MSIGACNDTDECTKNSRIRFSSNVLFPDSVECACVTILRATAAIAIAARTLSFLSRMNTLDDKFSI